MKYIGGSDENNIADCVPVRNNSTIRPSLLGCLNSLAKYLINRIVRLIYRYSDIIKKDEKFRHATDLIDVYIYLTLLN